MISALVISLCLIFGPDKVPSKDSLTYIYSTKTNTSYESCSIGQDKAILPFLGKIIDNKVLDSMATAGSDRDSFLSQPHIDSGFAYLPPPVYLFRGDMTLMYSRRIQVKCGECTYSILNFIGNLEPELQTNTYVEIFYITGIGVVGAVNINNTEGSVGWDQYILRDIMDKQGNSIIMKSQLLELTKKTITY